MRHSRRSRRILVTNEYDFGERDEVKPSIEMAAAIADGLEVSLDYLVGNTDLLLDKSILERIMEIQKLNVQEQQDAFKLLDMFLRDAKARKAHM